MSLHDKQMSREHKVERLVKTAEIQHNAYSLLEKALFELAPVPNLNWREINKAADGASLALKALRANIAIEIGRTLLGDEVEAPPVNMQPEKMEIKGGHHG